MGKVAPPLKIRAHHLLCMLGFRGLGYSQEFATMMGKVVEELRSDSTFPITVLAECDVICVSCPHNRDNKCVKKADSEPKVKAKDLDVLRRLGLEVGAQVPVGKAWARVRQKVTLGDLGELCRHCEWLELGFCAEGLESLRTG